MRLKKIRNFLYRLIGVILLIFGIIAVFWEDIQTTKFNSNSSSAIEEFNSLYNVPDTYDENEETIYASASESEDEEDDSISGSWQFREYDEFYEECVAYNEKIYADGQSELVDPFSVVGIPTGLSAENALFGYLTIPAMDLEIPVYIGADSTNLAKGAAILSQTSMPISESILTSTNCVIAGHRGYQGIPYFRNIEELQIGDHVYLTNQWERLDYVVTSIAIIDPDDVNAIKIQEGRQMLTLLTCHPYRSGGKYRYLVFCDLVGTITADELLAELETENETATAEVEEDVTVEAEAESETKIDNRVDEEFESSAGLIQQEQILHIIGAIILLVAMIILFFPFDKVKKKMRGL